MEKIDFLDLDEVGIKMMEAFVERVKQLPPPPEGWHYGLGEPSYQFVKDTAGERWEVTNEIVLKRDGEW